VNKLLVYTIALISLSSLILTGILVKNGLSNQTQSVVVEFEYAGRFEIVHTHHGVSETFLGFGKHQMLISRTIGEHWGISFFAQRLDGAEMPLFVFVKTLDGDTVFSTVLASQDSFLNMDCTTLCEFTE
jgi:hypothetical protein